MQSMGTAAKRLANKSAFLLLSRDQALRILSGRSLRRGGIPYPFSSYRAAAVPVVTTLHLIFRPLEITPM